MHEIIERHPLGILEQLLLCVGFSHERYGAPAVVPRTIEVL